MHKARVCPTGLEATLKPVFVSIYQLREFLFSAVTNRFELMCQLKQLMLLYYKNLSLFLRSLKSSERMKGSIGNISMNRDFAELNFRVLHFLPNFVMSQLFLDPLVPLSNPPCLCFISISFHFHFHFFRHGSP